MAGTTEGLAMEPLEDGYHVTLFLQKYLLINDTSGDFYIVLRPSFLRGSTNLPLFCVDIALELFGIVGNLTSIYVLAQRYLRSSTSILLSSMAVYDTIILVSLLVTMLNDVISDMPFYTPRQTTALNTVFQTSGMASVYTAVAVTIERYLAVRKPMKARILCTSTAAVKAIVGIFITSIIACIPRLIQIFPDDSSGLSVFHDCASLGNRTVSHLIYCSLFPVTIILIIPFMIISVLNVKIWRGLKQRGRNMKSLGGATTLHKGDNLTMSILGATTFFFLCCTFPAVFMIIDGISPDITHAMGEWGSDICSSLVILNFSGNFAIYCILGQTFRGILVDKVCCGNQDHLRRLRLQRKRSSSVKITSI